MKRVLKWLALLFAVSSAVFVLIFLYIVGSDEPIQHPKPLVFNSSLKKQQGEAFWLNHLLKLKEQKDYFPMEEVYIRTNMLLPQGKKGVYALQVGRLDSYQLFCLQEELKRRKFRYAFNKQPKSVELYVESKNRKKVHDLTKVLKNYKIDAKIINEVNQ